MYDLSQSGSDAEFPMKTMGLFPVVLQCTTFGITQTLRVSPPTIGASSSTHAIARGGVAAHHPKHNNMDALSFHDSLRVPGMPSDRETEARGSAARRASGNGSVGGIFRSFWMGGYEGADHRNGHGHPLDIGRATGHTDHPEHDYASLAEFGIRTVRESVGWRLIERDGEFDFSILEPRLDAARRCGIQVAWTLCHYGWPEDIDVFDDRWIDRFVRYAKAAAQFIADRSAAQLVVTPINEISFLTWAVCETGLIHPHCGGRSDDGYALKRRLVRAAIAGIDAIRDVVPDARFLSVDPVIHLVAPADRPDLVERAERERSFQFQSWDMLAGHVEPELGGSPRHLDVVGINYYHGNQWEIETEERLHWHMNDPRRVSLRSLLGEVAMRYRRPMVIAETSHVGVGRGDWIREVAQDVATAIADGIAIDGICLYPIIDRPDWQRPDHWHNSGLWDIGPAHQQMPRILCRPYAEALVEAQRLIRAVDPAPRAFLHHPLNDGE